MRTARTAERRFLIIHKYFDDGEAVYDFVDEDLNINWEKYLTQKDVDTLINKLKERGWEYEEEYEEWNNGGTAGVLLSPNNGERIYIVRAGRTVREVIEAAWKWLRKHNNKKLRIELGFYHKEGPFIDSFLSLFQNVYEDENGHYVGYVNVERKKKQIAELIEAFLSGYAPAEYCFYADDYVEGWGLEIDEDENVLCLWEESKNNDFGTQYYIKLEVLED